MGDRKQNLITALEKIKGAPGISLKAKSHVYLTQPQGISDQDWFLNSAALFGTSLNPRSFLNLLLEIEKDMGRVRDVKWGPREIDLDILSWENEIINEPGLEIPHPHLHNRRFVLMPLNDISPNWIHPQLKLNPSQMIAKIPEEGQKVLRQ